MHQIPIDGNFESWRLAARMALVSGYRPEDVLWVDEDQPGLFSGLSNKFQGNPETIKVPKKFVTLAQAVACFDDFDKWSLLYRILFRISNENRNLLEIESDDDVHRALMMKKAVDRDVHKFHAFVRFRLANFGSKIFIAWHEPTHFTVERAAPFFVRRFREMRFSILTPKGCAHWDLKKLMFSSPAPPSQAPEKDEMEDFWLTYYKSIYNPFRLKIKAMKSELPVKHWKTLPEAALIPYLIREADEIK